MNTLETLEMIGGILVFAQATAMLPSIYRLYRDKSTAGISMWTMGAHLFVSWYYVPVFWLAELWWTMAGVIFMGVLETIWLVWAWRLNKSIEYTVKYEVGPPREYFRALYKDGKLPDER